MRKRGPRIVQTRIVERTNGKLACSLALISGRLFATNTAHDAMTSRGKQEQGEKGNFHDRRLRLLSSIASRTMRPCSHRGSMMSNHFDNLPSKTVDAKILAREDTPRSCCRYSKQSNIERTIPSPTRAVLCCLSATTCTSPTPSVENNIQTQEMISFHV